MGAGKLPPDPIHKTDHYREVRSGCGTGRLVFQLAGHCGMVRGIEPSDRNIRRAQALYRRRAHRADISFESASLGHHLTRARETFDVEVVSYVLHEVDEGARAPMVRLLAGAVRTVILADYKVPRRRGLMDTATEAVEFLAGREHYRGFGSFVRRGEPPGLVREIGLQVLGELACSQPTAQVLRLADRAVGRHYIASFKRGAAAPQARRLPLKHTLRFAELAP